MASPTHNPDSGPAKTLTLELAHDDSVEEHPSAAAKTGKHVYSRRKRNPNKKKASSQKRKADKMFEVLIKTLNPIPFVPGKNLDFAGHEKLLKRLGLWDFVHLEFDREIRSDLVAQLVANFNQTQRCSRVNDFRVGVNRADMARALKLPVRKVVAAVEEEEEELAVTEESKGFILELLSNWVLLHDDTWIMPEEVVGWMGLIKEGELEKLDWARMIWSMAEKELLAAQGLVDCYYASHFQCLIKFQKGGLFLSEEGHKVEGDVVKEEVDAGGDVTMSDAGEEQNTEVTTVVECDVAVEHNVEPSGGEKEIVVEEVVKEAEEDVAGIVGEEVGVGVAEKVVNDVPEKVDEELGVDVAEKEDDHVSEKVDEEEAVVADADVFGKVVDDVVEKANEDVRKEEGEEEEQIMDENSMDFEGTKEEIDQHAEWSFVNNNEVGDNIFLRQCSFGVELNKDSSFEVERKQEEEEEEEEEEENEDGVGLEEEDGDDVEEDDVEEVDEGPEEEEEEEEEETGEEHEHEDEQGFQMSPKELSLDCFPSGGLLHSIEAAQMSLSPVMPLRDPLGADFLSSRDNSQMRPLFGNGSTSKREHSLENDDLLNPLSNKRLRVDGSWEHDTSSITYKVCLHQIEMLARKARQLKDEETDMNQQVWRHEVRQRDEMIEQLDKMRIEEQHRKDMDLYRLDRELNMMTNLLQSYRKALKETQREFAEYRARNPQPHDPVYKDVPASGGLVVSSTELEKLLLKQEEEARVMRMAIEREVKEFEVSWEEKFSEFGAVVDTLVNKLLSLEGEMKLLMESYAARKMSDPPESAQTDS